MVNESATGANRPYLAMGLTFLLLGVGFACPWRLVPAPPPGIWEGKISFEVLNLYALTAFLGSAHFFYAWQGQWRGSQKMPAGRRWAYWGMVAVMLAVLVALRGWMGVGIFSLVVWVYNISHFVKAEVYFARKQRRSEFNSPAIAFAWLTLVLFPFGWLHNERVVFAVTVLMGATMLVRGAWRALAEDRLRLPLLTLFLLGEALVWSAYGPYMSDAFRVGVYVFHIAAAGFYHYLSSYFYANNQDRRWLTSAAGIVTVNVLFVAAGCVVARVDALRWARVLLAPEWFTLWVALHLAASDVMPWWKKRGDRVVNDVPVTVEAGR